MCLIQGLVPKFPVAPPPGIDIQICRGSKDNGSETAEVLKSYIVGDLTVRLTHGIYTIQ